MKNIICSLLMTGYACTLQAAAIVSYTAIAAPGTDPDGFDGASNVAVWTADLPDAPDATGAWFLPFGGGDLWVIYSNALDASVTHDFLGGPLLTGQTVSMDYANFNLTNGNPAGIRLLSGNDVVFTLYYAGNGSGDFLYTDAGTTGGSTGQVYNGSGVESFSLTLTSATIYTATFGTGSFNGTLSGAAIDAIQVFNNGQTGGTDSYFRNLSVSGVPEPGTSALIALAGAMLAVQRARRRKGGLA